MLPSPSLGPPLLSPSWSPPLFCGIGFGGGGGGGGAAVLRFGFGCGLWVIDGWLLGVEVEDGLIAVCGGRVCE
jgi:hypothetical protein